MVIVRIKTTSSGILPATMVAIDAAVPEADLIRSNSVFIGTDCDGNDWLVADFAYEVSGRLFARDFVLV